MQKPIQHYFLSTDKFYYLVRDETNQQTLSPGVNIAYGENDYSNLDVIGHDNNSGATVSHGNSTGGARTGGASTSTSGASIRSSRNSSSSGKSNNSSSGSNIVHRHHKFDYFLFEERKRPAKECYDGLDRHGKS